MGDVFASIVRTLVPMIAGCVISFGAWAGLGLDSEAVAIGVTTVVAAVYYTFFRLLEDWSDKIGNPHLRTFAGMLLGFARPPKYPKPPGEK